jgi:protein-disulfide isomerase
MRVLPLSLLGLFGAWAASCAHEPSRPVVAAAPSPLAARIGDTEVTLAEVDDGAKSEIYEARAQSLHALIDERVVAAAAKKAGQPPHAFVDGLAAARVPEVSAQEAKQFFDDNKDRLPAELTGKPYGEVQPIIIHGLTEQKRQEAARAILGELREAAHVQVLLDPPKIDVAATGPARGAPNAKVTIVEFSDFQCPFCARTQPVVQEVLKRYDGKVRIVFRDFPLSFHGDAAKAAEAGHCADELGRFWPLHDWMFDHQHNLAVDDLKGAATQLGLDRKKFDACLDSGRYADAVAANQKDGEKAGVTGTPAFFINGAMIKGAQPFSEFQAIIDRALAK